MDVYSDWIDACDAVANNADAPEADGDGREFYTEMISGNERTSEIHPGRHLLATSDGVDNGQGDLTEV